MRPVPDAETASQHKLDPARVLVPLGALLALLPFVSGAMGLIAGALLGLTLGNPYAARTRKLATRLLQASVIGLGFGMDLHAVMRAGAHGVGWTVAGIAGCLALGTLLAKLLRVAGRTGWLISVGTAICGGSAIAAVAPVLRAEEEETATALATVFLLNSIALLLFPRIGHLAGLSQEQFGMWAALAIHDTSSVVGAGRAYGPRALEVATTVKLTRALWIVPLTLLVAWFVSREDGAKLAADGGKGGAETGADAKPRPKPAKPWFIAGFLAAAALVTFVPALHDAGMTLRALAQQLLVATLFLIGAGISRAALAKVGARPLAQGVLLWLCAALVSLAALKLS